MCERYEPLAFSSSRVCAGNKSAVSKFSHMASDGVLRGRWSGCSVFDMPIPMFDLRANSVLAVLVDQEKISSLCSLDWHHSSPKQWREPDPRLHENWKPISHPAASGPADRPGFGLRHGVSVLYLLLSRALNVWKRLTHCGDVDAYVVEPVFRNSLLLCEPSRSLLW